MWCNFNEKSHDFENLFIPSDVIFMKKKSDLKFGNVGNVGNATHIDKL